MGRGKAGSEGSDEGSDYSSDVSSDESSEEESSEEEEEQQSTTKAAEGTPAAAAAESDERERTDSWFDGFSFFGSSKADEPPPPPYAAQGYDEAVAPPPASYDRGEMVEDTADEYGDELGQLPAFEPKLTGVDKDFDQRSAISAVSTAQMAKVTARLEMAFDICADKDNDSMNQHQFIKALGVMGKRLTEGEARHHYNSALKAMHEKAKADFDEQMAELKKLKDHPDYGAEAEEDGEVKAPEMAQSVPKPETLTCESFSAYYCGALTKAIDDDEISKHFRALVEGTRLAKKNQEIADNEEEEKQFAADLQRQRREMQEMDVTDPEMFLWSKDMRQVLTNLAERLSDEEADQLIRECRPLRIDSDPPGFERICFAQYYALLTDDTL